MYCEMKEHVNWRSESEFFQESTKQTRRIRDLKRDLFSDNHYLYIGTGYPTTSHVMTLVLFWG